MMLLVMEHSRKGWLLSTLFHSSLVDKLSPTILHGWRVVSGVNLMLVNRIWLLSNELRNLSDRSRATLQ